jgi:antitoxin (DNA-binding transcriptional repressor) of toxin-antitoxin stability system
MANQLISKISATELARNLASVIDQVRVGRLPMTITRGNQDIAQIIPVINNHVTLADLSLVLNANRLSNTQKKAFSTDISAIRQSATLPLSSWE